MEKIEYRNWKRSSGILLAGLLVFICIVGLQIWMAVLDGSSVWRLVESLVVVGIWTGVGCFIIICIVNGFLIIESDIKTYMVLVGILESILLLFVWLEQNTNWVSISGTLIVVGNFSLKKSNIYAIMIYIMLPLITELIFRMIGKLGCRGSAVLGGFLAMSGLSIGNIYLFQALGDVYILDMAIWHVVLVVAAYILWARDDGKIQKKGIVGIVVYAALWGAALYAMMQQTSGTYSAEQWGDVGLLLSKSDRVFALIYMVVLIGFLGVVFWMLDIRNSRAHMKQMLYLSCAWVFLIRTSLACLYALALIPYPVDFPFMGDGERATDMVLFGLLFMGAYENYTYREVRAYKFTDVEKYFGDEGTFTVELKDFTDDDRHIWSTGALLSKNAIVRHSGSEEAISCIADEVGLKEHGERREFYVFYPNDTEDKYEDARFILEKRNETDWAPVKDREIEKKIIEVYKWSNMPEYIEDLTVEPLSPEEELLQELEEKA